MVIGNLLTMILSQQNIQLPSSATFQSWMLPCSLSLSSSSLLGTARRSIHASCRRDFSISCSKQSPLATSKSQQQQEYSTMRFSRQMSSISSSNLIRTSFPNNVAHRNQSTSRPMSFTIKTALDNGTNRKRKMSSGSNRLAGFDKPTVWQEFTPLANKHKAVNLGQGFPDWESPAFCKEAFIKAIQENHNQYCRSAGEVNLVTTIAKQYSPLVGQTIDPLTEVAVSVGATECLFAIMQAYIGEGDEVVTLEPAFDIYTAQVQMAGGKTVMVPLYPPTQRDESWNLDFVAFEAAITPKTKLILLNTPHNPTGRVFSRDELTILAGILERHPHVTCICDEVYENIVFSSKGHTRLASLPGMWSRVITVSSAGKTFSVTGWKVGWAIGPKTLIEPIILANQWVQFSVSTPAQKAIADMFVVAANPYQGYSSYYEYLHHMYTAKMQHLVDSVSAAGLIPLKTEGSFFLLCDIRNIQLPAEFEKQTIPDNNNSEVITRDWAFCRWLTTEIGIAAIPCSAFYEPERKHIASNLIRLCFCKVDETLEEARRRLLKLKPFIKNNNNNNSSDGSSL